jgi:hypothetical protein
MSSSETLANGGKRPPVVNKQPRDQPDSQILRQIEETRKSLLSNDPHGQILKLLEADKIKLTSDDSTLKQRVVETLSRTKNRQPNSASSSDQSGSVSDSPTELKGLPAQDLLPVAKELKALLNLNSLAGSQDAIIELNKNNYTSLAVAQIPLATFVSAHEAEIGTEAAVQTHSNAVGTVARNNQVAMRLFEAVKGTGIATIDGKLGQGERLQLVKKSLAQRGVDINLESLFGSMDQAMADESTTVYSPAAYFVELLEYLRHNNLDPENGIAKQTIAGQADNIEGSPLEHLFRKRPDLGNLELTPENTNTVIPYIDIANEVMESFVVNLASYNNDGHLPKQVTIEAHNVQSESAEELLSQPQYLKREAYHKIAAAAYPASLPYNQPLDAQRAFLGFLKSSRVELAEAFRPKPPAEVMLRNEKLTTTGHLDKLLESQGEAIARQIMCEKLGLSQEEYRILTKEVFWPKTFFDVIRSKPATDEEHRQQIEVPTTAECWGYGNEAQLLDQDESKSTGLFFVKRQLLPRADISYKDLIAVLQTGFVNPLVPTGRSMAIFKSLPYSYRFLQSLVNTAETKPEKRFELVAEFLSKVKWAVLGQDLIISSEEKKSWVTSNFEKIGKLTVLNNVAGPRLNVNGYIYATNSAAHANVKPGAWIWAVPKQDGALIMDADKQEYKSAVIGKIEADGNIVDSNGKYLGCVVLDTKAYYGDPLSLATLNTRWPNLTFQIVADNKLVPIGTIKDGYLKTVTIVGTASSEESAYWLSDTSSAVTSDLGKIRLLHLDETVLSIEEWDRLHRFIRLWKKLGWPIEDVDRALSGLAAKAANNSGIPSSGGTKEDSISFDSATGGRDWSSNYIKADINTDMLANIAAILDIRVMTGIALDDLLTFWAPMSYKEPSSIYRRLFCSRNLRTPDSPFSEDASGTFFTSTPVTLSSQKFVIMAAFNLKSADFDSLLTLKEEIPDDLSISTLSAIYRRVLLARYLGVGIGELSLVIRGFGDPFKDPQYCLEVLRAWSGVLSQGLTWPEVRYVCDSIPSQQDPLEPTKEEALRFAKDLHASILEIRNQHSVVTKKSDVTMELVEAKASLLFQKDVVPGIMSLISGSTVYTTSVPSLSNPYFSTIVAKDMSAKNARYILPPKPASGVRATRQNAILQFTGVLTAGEADKIKALIDRANEEPQPPGKDMKPSSNPPAAVDPAIRTAWIEAIDRARTQPRNFFYDHCDFVSQEVREVLMAPDLVEAPSNDPKDTLEGQDTSLSKVMADNTATPLDAGRNQFQKAVFFLQSFIPKLQENLTHEAVTKFILTRTGFNDENVVKFLLEYSLKVGKAKESAVTFLLRTFGDGFGSWHGYLIPEWSGEVKFIVGTGPQPTDPLVLGEHELLFSPRDKKHGTGWETPAVTLNTEQVYLVQTTSSIKQNLNWTARVDPQTIPDRAFQAWKGYIVPHSTDKFKFSVTRVDQPAAIRINHERIEFSLVQQDPEPVWCTTTSIPLEAEKLYHLELRNILPDELFWTLTTSSRTKIPENVFLPEFAEAPVRDLVERLKKLSTVLKHMKLTAEEMFYISEHASSFGDLEFEGFDNISQVKIMNDLIQLRDLLTPKATFKLFDLFSWAASNPTAEATELITKISSATGWEIEAIRHIFEGANLPKLECAQFTNGSMLVQIQQSIILATKLGIDIPRLYDWATPRGTADFDRLADIAVDIQNVARSRVPWSQWTNAVRPLNDGLRENQKQALISYLLVQDQFVAENNIIDADSLFEFFLIDVQMTSLVQTSRIKQAISTVQLFVQRVLLGLEKDIPPKALDIHRWEWMQGYRTWEANRKIFLYPENWIEPSLRDNKTEFFRQLESELLQKDLTNEAIGEALRGYLNSLDTVSNLQCIGLYVDSADNNKIHVFARTQSAPYTYFYNYYQPSNGSGIWRGWELMQVDIPHYEIGESGFVGNHVAPVVFQNRLYLFMASIIKVPNIGVKNSDNVPVDRIANVLISENRPGGQQQIKLGWTEYRNGRWTPRQMCPSAIIDTSLDSGDVQKVESFIEDTRKERETALQEYENACGAYSKALEEVKSASPAGSKDAELDSSFRTMMLAGQKFDRYEQELRRLQAARSSDNAIPIDSYGFFPTFISHGASATDQGLSILKIYATRAIVKENRKIVYGGWVFNGTQLSLQSIQDLMYKLEIEDMMHTSFGVILDPRNPSVVSTQSEEVRTDDQKWKVQPSAASKSVLVHDTQRCKRGGIESISDEPMIRSTNGIIQEERFYYPLVDRLLAVANHDRKPKDITRSLASFTVGVSPTVVLLVLTVGSQVMMHL